MTKAEQIRITVLAALKEGLSEQEAARLAGIEEERIWKILDALEWERPEPPPEKTSRKVTLPRSVHRSVKYKVQEGSAAKPRKRPPPKGTPIGRPSTSQHGTVSGYNTFHQGAGKTPICEPCKLALRARSAQRRHDKLIAFSSEEEVTIWLLGFTSRKEFYRCEICRFWHGGPPSRKRRLTRKEHRAFQRTTARRAIRRRQLLTTLPQEG